MLSGTEKQVLEFLQNRLLTTSGEISSYVNKQGQPSNGATAASIKKLMDFGYVQSLQSMGNCYVITQRGLRALKGQ